jgi:S-adenosyl-L-methionine hydrolase (adenosine-forming)
MSRPVLALLSDFGLRDHYVGSMKAAALSVCPDLTLVDITHDVAPHDVLDGAFQLAAAWRYFPAGTVFVAVVDPGVGSARRGIAAEVGDYKFVAPDNGLLTAVFLDTSPRRIVELTERRYFRPTVSRTFEGRDRFAPAAAWLLRGVELVALGRPVSNPTMLDLPRVEIEGEILHGRVLREDRFGNLLTNIDRKSFDRFVARHSFSVEADGRTIAHLVATYAEIPDDDVCALFGSADYLELAARSARASERLSLGAGASITVRRGPAAS